MFIDYMSLNCRITSKNSNVMSLTTKLLQVQIMQMNALDFLSLNYKVISNPNDKKDAS